MWSTIGLNIKTIVYLNDIANESDTLRLTLFADDTNLFTFDGDLKILVNLVNRELELLSTYFKINKLPLNVNKSVFMVFKVHAKNMMQMWLTIEYYWMINYCNKKLLQLLGVYITKHLNWADHIHQVKVKSVKLAEFWQN